MMGKKETTTTGKIEMKPRSTLEAVMILIFWTIIVIPTLFLLGLMGAALMFWLDVMI